MKRAAVLLSIGLPALLGGCNMVVMNPTGDIAVQQRNLILFSTGVMLLIIVPVMVLTVVFARKYRRGNANKTYDPKFDHSTTLELVIWSCPLLIIIALSVVTWTSTHLLDPFRPLDRIAPGRPVPAGTRPLEIQVVAMDWKWLFIYPEQGIATVNELALPVDRPVHFTITSTDQMNTFYAPTLAGMIYAMPGMQSQLNAVLNSTGDSWGYSGNYTGRGYSDMRFRLRGVDAAGFERWVSEARGSGGLAAGNYLQLEQPSERVPVMRFSSVAPGLFDRIVNRCVAPGTVCASEVMMHDRTRGMPPSDGREAIPSPGTTPTPALQRAPAQNGSGPNVTRPAQPNPPGQRAPGDQRNRDMSAIPFPLFGAACVVQA